MNRHGRPYRELASKNRRRNVRSSTPASSVVSGGWSARRLIVLRCLLAWLSLVSWLQLERNALAQLAPPDSTETFPLRLRINWGGGAARTWTGKFQFDHAKLKRAIPLSMKRDASATAMQSGNEVIVGHWQSTRYGGVDVILEARLDAKVTWSLSCKESPQDVLESSATIRDLLRQQVVEVVDRTGNQLSLSRPAFDEIAVQFDRQHLVFDVGDPDFSLRWGPSGCGLLGQPVAAGQKRIQGRKVRGSLKLTSAETGRHEFAQTTTFSLDENGFDTLLETAIPIPEREGVYQIELTIEPAGFQPFGKKATWRRLVEFVVIDRKRHPPTERNLSKKWKQVDRILAAEGVKRNNGWQSSARSTFGNDRRTVKSVNGKDMLELQSGAWHTVPVQMEAVGQPHVIEVDYLIDGPLSLGISLLEKTDGQVPDHGADSGVYLPATLLEHPQAGQLATHRMLLWPTTKSPHLMLVNRHAKRPVVVSEIRVVTGPSFQPRLHEANDSKIAKRKRGVFRWIESPLFYHRLGVLPSVDPKSGERLESWQTFYVATERLIDQLRLQGYSGAYLTVAADGSAIFPSKLLAPSPKFDRGIFFTDGRDPIRKDVLEMMTRMFERADLLLVPVLAFNAPLAEVELAGGDAALLDFNQAIRNRQLSDVLPAYNPLDLKVQRSTLNVIESFGRRYATRESFQGIAIACRPDTVGLLPGRQWGYDADTIKRFSQAYPEFESAADWRSLRNSLLSEHQSAWIQWRADEINRWYRAIEKTLADTALTRDERSDSQAGSERIKPTLTLAYVDLYKNEELAAALSPSLHRTADFAQQMLSMGIDSKQVAEPTQTIRWLVPKRLAPDHSSVEERVNIAVATSNQANRFYEKFNFAGDLYHHQNVWAQFDQLQTKPPFEQQVTPIKRLQATRPATHFARERLVESVHQRDAQLLVDGGNSLDISPASEVHELIQVYRELSERRFSDVPSPYRNSRTLPVAVRQLRTNEGTQFYLVNASPWPVRVKMVVRDTSQEKRFKFRQFWDRPKIEIAPELRLAVAERQERERQQESTCEVTLDPYSLVAGESLNRKWEILSFDFSMLRNADRELRREVYELQAKLRLAKKPIPQKVLSNPRFEVEPHVPLPGWQTSGGTTFPFEVKTSPRNPQDPDSKQRRYLRVVNDGTGRAAWLRSDPIAVPKTGRLSVSMLLRVPAAETQPDVRISIEGKTESGNYYRFGSVGVVDASAQNQSRQVTEEWNRFAVHFDDLPIGSIGDLRVGLDLMSGGEVHVTEVALYDQWLDENDAKAISQLLASTDAMMLKPELIERCRRLLNNYWAIFLRESIRAEGPAGRPTETQPESAGEGETSGMLEQSNDATWPEVRQKLRGRSAKSKAPMFRRLREITPRR